MFYGLLSDLCEFTELLWDILSSIVTQCIWFKRKWNLHLCAWLQATQWWIQNYSWCLTLTSKLLLDHKIHAFPGLCSIHVHGRTSVPGSVQINSPSSLITSATLRYTRFQVTHVFYTHHANTPQWRLIYFPRLFNSVLSSWLGLLLLCQRMWETK